MIFLGLDPGAKGGAALIMPKRVAVYRLENIIVKVENKKCKAGFKNQLETDVAKLRDWIYKETAKHPLLWPYDIFCCIEFLHFRGGNFAKAFSQLLKNYGRLLAALDLWGMPRVEPVPKIWQKHCNEKLNVVSLAALELLGDEADTKAHSLAFCAQEYPQVDLKFGNRRIKNAFDGPADALCMARYAKDIWLRK